MPLPDPNTAWPPPGNSRRYSRFSMLMAWLAGDPDMLGSAYGARTTVTVSGGPGTTLNPQGAPLTKRVSGAIRRQFWTQTVTTEIDTRRHLGVAQEIATFSSESLYSEPLRIKVLGPVDAEGEPTRETRAAQLRLERVLDACNFHSTLLAAGEFGATLGSYGLRIAFDKTGPINDRPVLARADADEMVPVYSWGQLVAVIFWRQVRIEQGDVIWRHLEMHEGGKIFHGLYKGTAESLGEKRLLTEWAGTAHLAPLVDADGAIVLLPEGGATAVSIPNMLPDPLNPKSYAGRSHFTPAVLDLFDAIDSTYSQLMDSIDDAKSRLLIAESMLERNGAGKGVTFDTTQRIFTKLKVPPADREGGGLPIEKVQFEMRVEEYLRGLAWLIGRAIHEAGYTTDEEAGESRPDMTATEYRGKAARTMATRDKQIGYAQNPLEAILTSLLQVDVNEFAPTVDLPAIPASEDGTRAAVAAETGVKVLAFPVEVTFPDAVQASMNELATLAKLLRDAGAADTLEAVGVVHPDWEPSRVKATADRIDAGRRVVNPDTIGLGGAGL